MNTHLQHIEDLILTKGMDGALETLRLFHRLSEYNVDLTIKIDGAPAFKCYWNGDEFRLHYKTSSIPHTINTQYQDPKLKLKMDALLQLSQLPKFEGVLWGDYLFRREELKFTEDGYLYHPNTLIYSVMNPYDLGVAFHTLEGSTESLQHYRDRAWKEGSINIYIKNIFVRWNEDLDMSALREAYHGIWWSDKGYIDSFAKSPMAPLAQRFFNDKIRKGVNFKYEQTYDEFIQFVDDHYKLQIDMKKTMAAKARWSRSLADLAPFFDHGRYNMIMRFMEAARVAKLNCINRLNRNPYVWVLTHDGKLERTFHEGYVLAIDGCETVKLVDRSKFSHYNFSSDFVKGWEKLQ